MRWQPSKLPQDWAVQGLAGLVPEEAELEEAALEEAELEADA